MHRRKKRKLVDAERACIVCQKQPWLASLAGGIGGEAESSLLKTNIVDEALERCGHQFCFSCIQANFDSTQRQFFPCPSCGAPVRQRTLENSTRLEADAARSRDKRAKVMKIRNKGPDAFATIEEFDNYLEESARIIDNLEDFREVDDTERSLVDYERQHRGEIELNESKKNSRRIEERNRARLELELLKEAKRVASTRDALQPSRHGDEASSSPTGVTASFIDGPQDLFLTQPKPLRYPDPRLRASLSIPSHRRALAGGAYDTAGIARSLRVVFSGLNLVSWSS